MTVREFRIWQAFDDIDPIGERRADLREALHMHLLAQCNIVKGRCPDVEDFLVEKVIERARREYEAKKTQDPKRVQAALMASMQRAGVRFVVKEAE